LQALNKLASECTKEASKLISILEKIKLTDTSSRNKNFRAALETAWKRDEIEASENRLRRYREELSLRILATLNAKSGEHGRDIIEILSINQELKSTIEDLRTSTTQSHQETIAAILTLRDGNVQTITRRPTGDFASDPSSTATRNSKTSITYKGPVIFGAFQTDEARLPASFIRNTADFANVPRQILGALYFRTINERQEIVADAHQSTFQWIYRDPEAHNKPWSDFVTWLRRGKGCYWISGKAGSGKSTLMKYIATQPRTRLILDEWADCHELMTASYFFWNAGTTLQKSQRGLLRAILFQILDKRPHLVPVVFPSLCRMLASQQVSSLELSFHELRMAFMILVTKLPPNSKMCLFIDGVDEYEGDHKAMSEVFLHASDSDRIKVVVSSRPIPACVQAFSHCPHLRLQDLTIDDINRYVEEKLSSHALLRDLESTSEGKGTTNELRVRITSRASGVFLWVYLAVKSLLTGLENYDTRIDLLLRLDRLPSDLEALYKHMLGSVSQEYQRSASLMIQLLMRSTEIQTDEQMTVLQLSFAEEAPEDAIKAPSEAIEANAEKLRCKATEGRIRSRCCGLIESQETSYRDQLRVGFLHRTVIDFLRDPKVQKDLELLTQGSNLILDELLLASSLLEMKRKPPETFRTMDSRAYINMVHCLKYSVSLEHRTRNMQTTYLNEVYSVMAQYSRPSPGVSPLNPNVWIEQCLPFHGIDKKSFLGISDLLHLLFALNGHDQEAVSRLHVLWGKPQNDLLLLFMLLGFTSDIRARSNTLLQEPRTIAGVKALLENGANLYCPVKLDSTSWQEMEVELPPSRTVTILCDRNGDVSAWTYFICYLSFLNGCIVDETVLKRVMGICTLLAQMLSAGADVAVIVRDCNGKRHSARHIIKQFIQNIEGKSPQNRPMFEQIKEMLRERRRARAKPNDLPTKTIQIKKFFGSSQVVNGLYRSTLWRFFSELKT
jgi:NACHT domain